jgi:hypothetical protein
LRKKTGISAGPRAALRGRLRVAVRDGKDGASFAPPRRSPPVASHAGSQRGW